MTGAVCYYTASRISTAKLTECLGEVNLTKKGIAMQSDEGREKEVVCQCGGMLSGNDVEQQL